MVFVLLIGGYGLAMQRSDYLETRPEVPIVPAQLLSSVARDLDTEVFFMASKVLNSLDEPNLAQANLRLEDSFSTFIEESYDPKRIDDLRVTIKGHALKIMIKPMSVNASTCTDSIGQTGQSKPFTSPTYYQVKGDMSILIVDGRGKNDPIDTNITIDILVPNLAPFVSTRLNEFEANGLSEFTDIGRMVRYMLTTLVRFRTLQGYGTGPYDTEKHLLNEGDVELAVNIAVLLEEARIFGTYDRDSVNAVDHFYFNARDPLVHKEELAWEPNNPTGLRPWGSAELRNYGRYDNPQAKDPTRTLGTLFDTYVHEGLIDPADLMALYLHLDSYDSSFILDPTSSPSLIHSKFLFDGRYPDDRRDATHLEYLVDIGPKAMDFMDPTGDFGSTYTEGLSIDQYPDYLTVGSDLRVSKEITTPIKWMTNSRLKEGSRTGGVPPPQPPPEHDWVMLWEFEISGEFKIAVGRDPTASLSDGSDPGMFENRTISLDIPINIYTPLINRPMNSAVVFTNLNTGSPPGATYNFTIESLAYEQFSNYTWSNVKDVIDPVLEDTIRLVKGATCPYHGLISRGINLTSLQSGLVIDSIDDDIWTEVDAFVTKRLSGVGLSTQVLKPFLNLEYLMDIDYIDGAPTPGIAYELRMTLKTNMGDIAISMLKADGDGGYVEVDAEIVVDGLLDVRYELDWDDGFTHLRPSGGGTIDGDWTIPVQKKGPRTMTGVYVETGGSFAMMVIPDGGMTDPIGDVIKAIPSRSGLGSSAARTFIEAYSIALSELSSPSMTVLFSDGSAVGGWYGFEAESPGTVTALLAWINEHAEGIVDLSEAGRIEATALAMAAAEELAGETQLKVVIYKGQEFYEIPMPYYLEASQMFQKDLDLEPLRVTQMMDIGYDFQPDVSMAVITTYTFYEYSQIFLKDLEDPYED